MNHIELGQKGEDIATNHLIGKHYEIVDRNYRFRNAEIDIICKKDKKLIFVEVKTRHSSAFGEPYKAVTWKKQQQIIKVANHYIKQQNSDDDIRLDVISIVLNQFGMRLEHIEHAFTP